MEGAERGGGRKRGEEGGPRSRTAPPPRMRPAPTFSAGEEHSRGGKRTGLQPGSSEGPMDVPDRSQRPRGVTVGSLVQTSLHPVPRVASGSSQGRPAVESVVFLAPSRKRVFLPADGRRLAGPPHRRRARPCGPTFWPGKGEGTAATSEQKLPEAGSPRPAPSLESSTAACLAVPSDWLTSRPRGATSMFSQSPDRNGPCSGGHSEEQGRDNSAGTSPSGHTPGVCVVGGWGGGVDLAISALQVRDVGSAGREGRLLSVE